MRVFVRIRRIRRRLRGLVFTAWIRMMGGSVGRALQVDRGVTLRWQPHRGLTFGRDVYLGIGTIIDVRPGASLRVGDGVKIMHYSVIAAAKSLEIGPLTQIAEHCSVRDSDHGMELSLPMRAQNVSTETRIGRDVWIARGVAVLRGSCVGDGAVIGANSVVRGEIPGYAIAVGAPARVIRHRR